MTRNDDLDEVGAVALHPPLILRGAMNDQAASRPLFAIAKEVDVIPRRCGRDAHGYHFLFIFRDYLGIEGVH